MQDPRNTYIRSARPRPLRRGWRLLFLVLPLLACVVCLALAVLIPGMQASPSGPVELPVTGAETPVPAPTAPAGSEPGQVFTPAVDYGLEAEMRLSLCSDAFQNFFLIQHLAAMQPGLIRNDGWRSDADDAVTIFQRDCTLAESLPKAPVVYTEVDHWMRLASTEVNPAAQTFALAIQDERPEGLHESAVHLERFFQYIVNAEEAIRAVRLRREI